jgi:hypothetical protein
VTTSHAVTLSFDEREVAMMVAALRNWLYDVEEGQDLEEAFGGHFEKHRMLSEAETERLIGRFRFDESQGFLKLAEKERH